MTFTRSEIHQRIFRYGCFLIAFGLPVYNRLIPPVIVVLVLNWLIEARYLNFRSLPGTKRRILILSLASIYFFYLLGLLYTSNFGYASFDLEVKLSLLIFPLIFSTADEIHFSDERIGQVLRWFIAGCATGMILMIARATGIFFQSGDSSVFYYSKLSWYFHPGYLSMYFAFAVAILTDGLLLKEFSKKIKLLMLALLVAFLAFIFLLSSKTGILLALFLVPVFIIIEMIRSGKYIRAAGRLAAFIAVIVVLALVFPVGFSRLAVAGDVTTTNANGAGTDSHESTAARLVTWKTAAGLIGENFWSGVGTGDVKDALLQRYQERGNDYALKIKLNAHSQLLQTFIALGIGGFLVLIYLICLPGYFSLRIMNFTGLSLFVILLFNMMIESILETQAGVIFFGYFNTLMAGWVIRNKIL